MPALPASRSRRHMRKGTRSCTECRQRKIRCILSASENICNFCSARGIRCIDQRDVAASLEAERLAKPSPAQAGRYSGATRSIVGATTFSGPSGEYSHLPPADLSISTTHNRAPLVSLFSHDSESGKPILPSGETSKDAQLCFDRQEICRTLRTALPGFDDLISKFSNHGGWWESFRQKTRVISQSQPLEPLVSFSKRGFTSSDPGELGTLVICYARCLFGDIHQNLASRPQQHQLLRLVDKLVISDPEICASVGAMECLILLAKTYTDIGQPRRAWITWRKGLATAQLMGLHRNDLITDEIGLRIWSAIYHGDRFTSLLLGVAHGFGDGTTDIPQLPAARADSYEPWLKDFIHATSVIAGRVSEHNATPPNLSFAKAMQLDETLAKMKSSAPSQWWDLPTPLPTDTDQLTMVVDKILPQFFFFHTRMYLHLPFLPSSLPPLMSPSQQVGMGACADACRSLLKRYLILRTTVDGRALFDCATTDFVGFTASLVLLVAASSRKQNVGFKENDTDLALVADTATLFQQLERETGCRIASQSAAVLNAIFRHSDGDESRVELDVPYFGKLLLSMSVCCARRDSEFSGPATDSILETPNTSIIDPSLDFIDISMLDIWKPDPEALALYGIGWDIDQGWHLPEFVAEGTYTFGK